LPKSSIQKKAATTSKNGIGSKFEHPYDQNTPIILGTFAILVV
jgi:hypothetical protein